MTRALFINTGAATSAALRLNLRKWFVQTVTRRGAIVGYEVRYLDETHRVMTTLTDKELENHYE